MDQDDDVSAPPLRPPLATSVAPRDQEPDSSDIEKIIKWQQERAQRKLRGEYESQVLHLSELINASLSTPLRISSVRVEGATNTRTSFLGSLINPLLAAQNTSPHSDNHSTLKSVLHTTRHISHLLQEADVFKSVEANIECSRDLMAQDIDVDVVFKTREKSRFYLKTATEVGNGEGNASVTGHIRNVFGGAETLEAHISLGTATRRSFNAVFTAPLTSTLQTRGELCLFGMERDNTSYASSMEGLRGIRAVVRNGSVGRGMHAFTYEAVVRHLTGLTPTASMSIRLAAGQTVKSSLSYCWTQDTRDDKITATRGIYTKFYHELAGLGGDAAFSKTEAEGQLSRRLLPGLTISLAARTGFMWTFGSRTSLFSDRFQLGGPTNVRSFKANGLGPRDGTDSLGGDMYWSAGLSVISDLPRKPHWPLKTHLFVNAGRLDSLDKSRRLKDSLADCIAKPSVSVGVGFVYRFDPIRMEVNFGVPLVASASDNSRRGIQVGMGLEFL